MIRPLMQKGVDQLEELFHYFKSDPKVLKKLEHELQFRHVPRAVALLAEVQAALHRAPLAISAAKAPTDFPLQEPVKTQQLRLGDHPQSPNAAPLPLVTQPSQITSKRVIETPLEQTQHHQSEPIMPLDDAHKILKATPTSTWQSVEHTRRQLVEQSNPVRLRSMGVEKRNRAIAEAKRVNAAYAAIQKSREN